MTDMLRGVDALDDAKAVFTTAGLPMPWVPEPFHDTFERRGEWSYASGETPASPSGLLGSAHDAVTGNGNDFMVLTHDGHGTNSWAIQYWVMDGPIALFIRRSWGGVYGNREEQAREITAAFAAADSLLREFSGDGPLRCIVVDSDIGPRLWSTIEGPVSDVGFYLLDWITSDAPIEAALASLRAASD